MPFFKLNLNAHFSTFWEKWMFGNGQNRAMADYLKNSDLPVARELYS